MYRSYMLFLQSLCVIFYCLYNDTYMGNFINFYFRHMSEDNFEVNKKVYVCAEENMPSTKIISSETNLVFLYHLERAIIIHAVTVIDINV